METKKPPRGCFSIILWFGVFFANIMVVGYFDGSLWVLIPTLVFWFIWLDDMKKRGQWSGW
jgi:hypothetical protein